MSIIFSKNKHSHTYEKRLLINLLTGFQITIDPSNELDARCIPLAEKQQKLTGPLWPLNSFWRRNDLAVKLIHAGKNGSLINTRMWK